MATQRRSQRDTRAPERLAETQERPDVDRRRRANRGRRREQPVGEQLLIDDDEGVDVAADDPVAVEEGDDEGGGEDEAETDEGYDSFIEDRSRPPIPQPDPNAQRIPDSDGWSLIAKLGPLESFLSCFPALQEVPDQHKQAWTGAFSRVMRRWKAANTEEKKVLALSWFLFLSQGLLRRPTRGGRAGRKEVAARFNAVTREDWGTLVELWERDKANVLANRERRRRRRRNEPVPGREAEQEKRRREVVALISSGQISRAMSRVTSHGVASMNDPVGRFLF